MVCRLPFSAHDTATFRDQTLNAPTQWTNHIQRLPLWLEPPGPARHTASSSPHGALRADKASAPIQHAAPRWLELAPLIQSAILDLTRSNLAALSSSLSPASGARVLPCEGGWTAVLEVPRIRSEQEWVLHLLDSAGLLLQPGFFYDFPREAFLVASLLAPSSPDLYPALNRALST